jgi:glutathione S-transferase
MAVGTSSLVQSAYRACFPLLRPVLRRNMGLDAAAVARSVARMHAALDRLERELDGRSHLVGDAFSVADLTAAALFVPLVRPPEFPYPHARLPESAHALRNGLADRPGFRWVEETYRRHRGRARAAA